MITLADAKTWLKITTTDEDDRIQMIVDGVNQAARSYCGRLFDYDTYTERVYFENGFGLLKETPVESVSSVANTDEIEITEFEYHEDGQIWIGPQATLSTYVTYTGGYSSLPADLKLALLRWIEYFYHKPEGVTRMSFEGLGTQFERPSDVQEILDLYKVRRFL